MTIDEAIQHCEEVAEENQRVVDTGVVFDDVTIDMLYCDDTEVIEEHLANYQKCASDYRQLAEWLKELKAYRDARAEINQALYDDARGEQNDYERGRKSGIFLCESIISVKLGESHSEIPNTCGDAISRQSAIFLASDLKQDLPDDERIADMVVAHNEGILEYQTQLSLLPSVTPQQKMGRWIKQNYGWNWQCSECGFVTPPSAKEIFTFCPKCGCKMQEVES